MGLVIVGVLIIGLSVNGLLRQASVKLQPALPGVPDAPSWLETNCRGSGRDVEKCKATIEALEGSGADALKLASFMAPNDLSGRLYWLHIAAQNGNSEGMRRLAQTLAELSDVEYGRVHRIRARFWLERSAQAGDTEAKNLMKQISPVSWTEAVEHKVPNVANPNPELTCNPMPWWRFFAGLWGDADPRLSKEYLDCADIPNLEQDALRGGIDGVNSARKLGFFLTTTQQDHSLVEGMYWDRIGAENGDTLSKYNLGVIYAGAGSRINGNPDQKVRGQYWLRKAADEGYEYAEFGIDKSLTKIDLLNEWLNDEP